MLFNITLKEKPWYIDTMCHFRKNNSVSNAITFFVIIFIVICNLVNKCSIKCFEMINTLIFWELSLRSEQKSNILLSVVHQYIYFSQDNWNKNIVYI